MCFFLTHIWFKALLRTHNILFDPWWTVVYLWLQGCLGNYEMLEDLLTTKDDELIITSPNEPFHDSFLTSKPAQQKTFSNKIGSSAASLVLGHQDASSVLNKSYSYAAGNFDVVGIRTGEAANQFLPGSEDEPKGVESDTNEETGKVNKALTTVKESKKKAVNTAKDLVQQDDGEQIKLEAKVTALWNQWVDTMGPGSPLHMKASGYKPIQQNISVLKGKSLYADRLKSNKELEGRVENDLRAAFDCLNKHNKSVCRNSSQVAACEYEGNQHADTITNKDAAVAYTEKPTALIAEAKEALISKCLTSNDLMALLNQEEEEEDFLQALKSHQELLGFAAGQSNLVGGTQGASHSKEILGPGWLLAS
ncbi:hypothetical protein BDV93DRAFT_516430 [Ceratobasidium sp. AG-I]|nr:hypothetical protein BDV93DRAFT_516430 [Ceratobasidium sp. AG-I]